MKINRCPDCSTGWLYAEDLPKKHHHLSLQHDHGLVKCPTCNGMGRVLEPDDPLIMRATVTASSVQPIGIQPVCEQLPISSAYQIAALRVKNDAKWEPISLYATEDEPMPLYAAKVKKT
jgi:hypothetical protein